MKDKLKVVDMNTTELLMVLYQIKSIANGKLDHKNISSLNYTNEEFRLNRITEILNQLDL